MDQISLWVEEGPYKREQITVNVSNSIQKYNRMPPSPLPCI